MLLLTLGINKKVVVTTPDGNELMIETLRFPSRDKVTIGFTGDRKEFEILREDAKIKVKK